MFIKENRKQYPIALVCEVLQVSQSGYHKWLKNKVSFRVKENQRILEIIKFHHNRSKATYGLPRTCLPQAGICSSEKRRIWCK
jgi:hypothetical protein